MSVDHTVTGLYSKIQAHDGTVMAMDGRLMVFYSCTVIIFNQDITYMAKYPYDCVRLTLFCTTNHLKYLELLLKQDTATLGLNKINLGTMHSTLQCPAHH